MMNMLTIVMLTLVYVILHMHTFSQHTAKKGQKRLAESQQRHDNGKATPEDRTRLDNENNRRKYLVHVCFSCW